MSSIVQFFNGHPLRIVGDMATPQWIAQDVCSVLGIGNVSKTLAAFPEDEKGVTTSYTPGGTQTVLTVYESGLYRLIFKSRKSIAESFRRWVFHEVLPSIRETGHYDSASQVELITPELAQQFLDTQQHRTNRDLSEKHVQKLLKDMKSGAWVLTPQGISFDQEGVLRDGQHRLAALVRYGQPLQFHVYRGLSEEAIAKLDAGRSRTVLNRLQIAGVQITGPQMSVLRCASMTMDAQGGHPQSNNFTDAQYVELAERYHDQLVDTAHWNPATTIVRTTAVRAAFFRALVAHPEYRQDLLDAMQIVDVGLVLSDLQISSELCNRAKPLEMLRNYVASQEQIVTYKERHEAYAKATFALQAYLDRRDVKVLRRAKVAFTVPGLAS